MRFPCTDHSGGTLLFRPERACRIVTTCVVLHRMVQRSSTGKASIEMKFAYPLSLLYIESIHCDVECFDSYGRKPRMMYISNLASNVLWFYTAKRYLMMSDLQQCKIYDNKPRTLVDPMILEYQGAVKARQNSWMGSGYFLFISPHVTLCVQQ